MPIEEPSNTTAPVFFPNSNYSIARYLDLAKFLSLIQTKKIFFNKLSNFEDRYEGTLPELSYIELENWYRKLFSSHPVYKNKEDFNIEEEIKKDILEHRMTDEKSKHLICVSCWNKLDSESYALWKIYANLNQGIMIKSNINRLISAFQDSEEIIQLSEIKYINFQKDKIDFSNANYRIIHKNKPYNYENEIRLIHQVKPKSGFDYDWTKEENQNGKYINIDLKSLIEEIVISPFSPNWFFDIVNDIVDKYELSKKVRHSEFR